MASLKHLCVLVLKSDELLKRAAFSLMTLTEELEIVVSEAVDSAGLARDISKIKPGVVLLSENLPLSNQNTLVQLQAGFPSLKVVIVSVDSNWLYIFNKEDRLLTSLNDLLSVIRH